jgi:NhaP-type Na+/H+ or K+/H+ antiporter
MNGFTAESFAAALAIIGAVIIVSALLSGLIDRSRLPQVAVFLGLGAALGPYGLGVLNLSLQSPILRIVAILSLALVLFTDAISLNIADIRRHGSLAFRLLGPGTLVTAALIALAGWWLLGLSIPAAAILGAALASTDPVLLRGVLRRRDIPEDARKPLQLESGLNDAVLLPVVLVAMAFLGGASPGGAGMANLGLKLFILGPGAGVMVGLIAVAALDLIRKRLGVRRDYESLYSLGVAFTAFAAAEMVHGSGYLSAFAAGITIAALDVELCDCFVEYGAVTAEMLLLFTFVLLGGSLIWTGFSVISGPTLVFTAIAVLIRTPVYLLSLLGSDVHKRGRLLIAWFGPRGLSSLLLILLPVFAGVPGSDRLFAVCSLVVLVSVVVHGGSPMLLARIARKRALREGAIRETLGFANVEPDPSPESSAGLVQITAAAAGSGAGNADIPSASFAGSADVSSASFTGSADVSSASFTGNADVSSASSSGSPDVSSASFTGSADASSASFAGNADVSSAPKAGAATLPEIGSERISLDQLQRLWQTNQPVTILDVRTERSLEDSDTQAKGAVRLSPDNVVERTRELGLNPEAWLIAYCA